MSIYSRVRTKITIGTICISLGIIIGLWLLLFGVDYIMFKNNKPIIFGTTKVEEISGNHITVENGLGYYVITDATNSSKLYLFGHKIK